MNIYITTTFLGDTDTPNSFLGQAGKLAAVNATEDALEFIDLSPGGSSPISGTYSDFDNLKSTNALETGRFYWMTDYATIYDQPDYDDADTPKATVVTKTAPVDPILLLATSPNTFAKEVWRPSTPQHRLEYDFDYVLTEYMNAPAKGRITKCIDEFGNETQYDHSVVLLKRYESVSGSGVFDSFWDTGFASVEVKTFGSDSFNNVIGSSGIENGNYSFIIGNNVLKNNSISNKFFDTIHNNSFGSILEFNTFHNSIRNNVFGDGFFCNHIYDECHSNIFGNDIIRNSFLGGFDSNIVLNDVINNIFGPINRNNIIGNDFQNNETEQSTLLVDFTSATHVYQPYPCRIFKRQDGTIRLSYTDNTDTLVVVDPTD